MSFSVGLFKTTAITALVFLCLVASSLRFGQACTRSEGIGGWPAESASSADHLAQLDTRLETQQSGVFWNEQTNTLWTTTGGNTDAHGTFALLYAEDSNDFSLFAQWDTPRGEDLTQAIFLPVNIGGVICHQVYFIDEDNYAIVEALMAEPVADTRRTTRASVPPGSRLAERMSTRMQDNNGEESRKTVSIRPGESQETRRWVITELVPSNKKGAEALSFVSDAQLVSMGFVDGQGRAWTHSNGGLDGLMFVGHQVKGIVYAIDLSATGTAIFPNNKNYAIVGAYQTAYDETSALFFDASVNRMYISHNTDGNHVEVSDLTSDPLDSSSTTHLPALVTRKLRNCWVFETPSELNNPEGFACSNFLAPNRQGRNQQSFAFWANDAEGGHHTQRSLAITWFKQFNPAGLINTYSVLVQQSPTSTPHADVANPSSLTVGPFVVKLFDSHGYPVVNTASAITCQPLDAAGSIEVEQPSTNGTGFASCGRWTLAPSAYGTQQLRVSTVSSQTIFTAVLLGPVPTTQTHSTSTVSPDTSAATLTTATTTTNLVSSSQSTTTTSSSQVDTTSTENTATSPTTSASEEPESNSSFIAVLVVALLFVVVAAVVLVWYIRMGRVGNQAPAGFSAVPLDLEEYDQEEEEDSDPHA